MYKELIISIIILALIIGIDMWTKKYTVNTINKTNNNLCELKENLENKKDKKEILKKIDDIDAQWKKHSEVLVCFIEHNELEKVDTNFVACKSFVKTEDYNLAMAKLEEAVFVLEHISEKYALSLENIF